MCDLGCGPGNSTEVLAARFPDAAVEGVDSSPDMIAAAQARMPGVQFTVAAIESWDDAGPFLRFSATYIAEDEAAEDTLMLQTVERLGKMGLRFE